MTMQIPERLARHLVLVGGGHAHVAVLRAFGMRRLRGLRLTLITPQVQTPYSGMLPGHVAGHYTAAEMHIDLGPLCRFAGADLLLDEAVHLDTDRRRLHTRHHPPVDYDLLSLDTGITPRLDDIDGAAAHAVAVKPISRFLERFNALEARLQASIAEAATDRPLHVGVVGGGAGGVELALAIRHRFRNWPVKVHLLSADDGVLAGYNRRARRAMLELLHGRDIRLHDGFRVVRMTPDCAHAADGRSVMLDEMMLVTDADAPPWLQSSGLALDDCGFVRISGTLQSVSHEDIFAVGDVAVMDAHPHPRAGVFAVRQGRPLARNLRRKLLELPLRPFVPQRRFLSLLATGDRHAIACRGRWYARGGWVWRCKDHIDRRFMARFAELPDMTRGNWRQRWRRESPAIPGPAEQVMPCGGCGAKVAADVLAAVVAELRPVRGKDVLVGLDPADDAAVQRIPPDEVLVHSVDNLRAFIGDPWQFGRIAAVHALSDLYAMGATPRTATAIVSLPYATGAVAQDLLRQVMHGVVEALNRADVALVGGHTSEAAELSVALAVNGSASPAEVLRKGGAEVGDALVLTKPLGTGILLAADMRGLARGDDVQQAIDCMLVDNGRAADILHRHGATALSDVTGFGLAGHLREMLQGSDIAVRLRLADLPLLPGAAALAEQGIVSTLHEANKRAAALADDAPPLLFDPQTSGGLLATLPMATAATCVGDLQAAGYPAELIGEVIDPADASVSRILLQ